MSLPETDDDRDPADLVAEEFADRLRRGERPSVSEYAGRFPDLADQLRDLLPAVAQMEQLKKLRRVSAAPAGQRPPDRLGDFRIIRELGRGGMGVVFEAEQQSLGRRVALKLLAQHAQLDSGRRERFLREAQAAAKLHHTNIVPVFGVGEQDGLPYYVMQLIPGQSLHAVVTAWRAVHGRRDPAASTLAARATETEPVPVPAIPVGVASAPEFGDWRFVARVGADVADALRYAHEEGVLHRDVKPGNLILDEHGRVWVTDFGLAKMAERDALTATGDIVGTLQYMAPESLHKQTDARSDVYGLGASLYELLTLEMPFDAATPAGVLQKLASGDPVPPRQLNPDIPRDLETIVLKAMAREPARRYPTAGALADDLRAFLDDRPIRARRTTAVSRAARWCRRNPLVASLLATTAAVVLAAGAFGWVSYVRTRDALAEEAKRRTEADEATKKFEANLALSLQAFEELFEAASSTDGRFRQFFGPDRVTLERGGPPVPTEHFDRAATLEQIVAFYDKFAEMNATNPRLQFEAAKAHRRVGQLRQQLAFRNFKDQPQPEETGKSATAFRRAAALLEELLAQAPDAADVKAELVTTYALSGVYPETPDGRADAERRWLRAARLGRELAEAEGNGRVAAPLGEALYRYGCSRERAKEYPAAEEAFQSALTWLAPRPGSAPGDPPMMERVRARQGLARVQAQAGRPDDARALLDESARELKAALGRGRAGMMAFPFADLLDDVATDYAKVGDPRVAEQLRRDAKAFRDAGPGFPGGPGRGGPFLGPKDGPPPPRKE